MRLVRGSPSSVPAAQELVSGLLSVAPAALALRGSDVAAYHGAEHISIGTYEHGEQRAKEHERCGSHLLGPLLATTAIGNALAARAPAHCARAARFGAAVGRRRRLDRDLRLDGAEPGQAARPGAREARATSSSTALATAEPTPEQIEVAEAALAACLELENA